MLCSLNTYGPNSIKCGLTLLGSLSTSSTFEKLYVYKSKYIGIGVSRHNS